MERDRRAPVITLFADAAFEVGEMSLDDAAAHHARVRRAQRGDAVHLVDGRGKAGFGEIRELSRAVVDVMLERIVDVPRPMALEIVVPIADRERMLFAAEKCVELQATAWRPAYFARSRSVAPRGEGGKFRDKVRARMQSALEQSGGAWLPQIHEDAEWPDVAHAVPSQLHRLLFDAGGSPLGTQLRGVPSAMVVGPEGGFEANDMTIALDSGWIAVSLGPTILRFETAVIAGAAVIRAAQLSARSA